MSNLKTLLTPEQSRKKINQTKPCLKSTGPRTEEGKAIARRNLDRRGKGCPVNALQAELTVLRRQKREIDALLKEKQT